MRRAAAPLPLLTGLLLAGLLLSSSLWAAAVAAAELPALTGRVVDVAGILPPEVERTLTERLVAQERATSNQVVVATVPSLQDTDIETFAVDLLRAWKLGQQGRDNGVLLLVAPNERRVRIEVGYGLEGQLTDVLAENIIETRILPRFRAGDFAGGVLAGAAAIVDVIDGAYTALPQPEGRAQAGENLGGLLPFLIFCLVMWMVMRRRRRSRWGRGFATPVIFTGGWGGGSGGGWGGGGGGFSGGGGSSGGGGASGEW